MGPEAKIQKSVVDYARETYKGKLIARKYAAGMYGTNGWEDYEFLIPDSQVFHMEFKAPGGKCTDLQLARHAELRAIGHRVYVVDNKVTGRKIIDREMQGFKKETAKLRARRKIAERSPYRYMA